MGRRRLERDSRRVSLLRNAIAATSTPRLPDPVLGCGITRIGVER